MYLRLAVGASVGLFVAQDVSATGLERVDGLLQDSRLLPHAINPPYTALLGPAARAHALDSASWTPRPSSQHARRGRLSDYSICGSTAADRPVPSSTRLRLAEGTL